MKLGKVKLMKILSRETGAPLEDVRNYGHYTCNGCKEKIELGGHAIVSANGEIRITDPVYQEDEVKYVSRTVKN